MNETVLVEREGAIAEIVLNRPERRNALTEPMRIALCEAVRSVSADDAVSVVVLRGAGGAFCSGIDLKALNESGPDPAARQAWMDVQVALYESDKIFIGALERFAINAGGPLVFGCDHLIVGESAFLQIGEIQQGVSPAMNLAWLTMKYGDALARRVTLRGDRIDAASLLRMGIASEVVGDDRVVARAREWAAELAGYPQAAAAGIKKTIRGLNRVQDPRAWFENAMALFPFAPGVGTPRVR
ncbi:MAG: enoyl-CoA hydratase/isomerase family protein [Burkholderiaceae bacterium]